LNELCMHFIKLFDLTWFLTGVTASLVLQSTVVGSVKLLVDLKVVTLVSC